MPKYRPDIDGLRGLAVLAVLLYHAGQDGFSGGFVGVDVFFVVSGYLITSLIVAERTQGRFSVWAFYARRMRRLFPALFVVLSACCVLAWFLFLPDDFRDFGQSVLATASFSSNVLFWWEAGYFDAAAELKPLLHTWSLAVEEQLYLIYPIYLSLAARLSHAALVRVTGALLALSFAANLYFIDEFPDATFYLAPTRAWEFLVGALLALGVVPPWRQAGARELAALAGLGLVAVGVVAFSVHTRFPGANALLPCLGTALIVHSGAADATLVRRALGWRPLVGLGLISYSLYLWHWPLLVFARYYAIRELTAVETIAALLLSLGLAILTWRYVERPFRGPTPWLRSRRALPLGAAAMAALSCFGLFVHAAAGLPGRLPTEIAALADKDSYLHPFRHCHGRSPAQVERGELCRIGSEQAAASFILWGDSHADSLVPAMDAAARWAGRAGFVATFPGCRPLLGVRERDGGRECYESSAATARFIASRPSIETVILGGYWLVQATGLGHRKRAKFYYDAESRGRSREENLRVFARGLERVFGALRQRRIVVIDDVPEVAVDYPSAKARSRLFGHGGPASGYLLTGHERKNAPVADTFAGLHRRWEFSELAVADVLCPAGRCAFERDGQVVFRDSHHLSAFGSLLLVERFKAIFAD